MTHRSWSQPDPQAKLNSIAENTGFSVLNWLRNVITDLAILVVSRREVRADWALTQPSTATPPAGLDGTTTHHLCHFVRMRVLAC